MAHHTTKSGYVQLVDRLNRFPQGAPPSKLLYKILGMLFSEKEAKLVSLLPLRPFSAEKAAQVWKMDRVRTQKMLDQLCGRAILLDIQENNRQVYCLPPPMAGFFEFSMMRIRGDIDQKLLSELYYQYLNVEEDFIKNLFLTGETKLGRVFVHEPVLSSENVLQILDYERATQVIKTASHIGISTCYCRHKMSHLGRDCDAPKEICMTFNSVASSLIKYDYARRVEVSECLELLETAYSHNLVQFGDNVREDVNFICNCCGCCCEAMTAARKFGILQPVHTTNFIPKIQDEACTGCRKCVTVCPVEAMSLVSANDPHHPKKKKARVNEKICLGCGICARVCPENCIGLKSRARRVITPLNTAHRVVVMAIEQGKLQELIFDNQVLESHRAMAAVLGVILKLPPIKQAMASQQMKSIYLEALVSRLNL
jgi:Pyruvate/2-oxoacid:ferredoxin oxidoreductase delta subunit